jgi:RNA polymerase sigma factor (sigma-70 family)
VRARDQADAGPRPAPSCFTGVYEQYFAEIHRYIAGRLGRDVADDIAADTFVIALRKHSGFDPERGPLRAWLYGIATNLVAQHRRTEKRRYQALARAGAQELADGHEDPTMPWATAGEMQPRLARALAGLSQQERDVLLLVALVDLSYEEISHALSVPYGTVCSRLNRARKKIRTALDQKGQIDE